MLADDALVPGKLFGYADYTNILAS